MHTVGAVGDTLSHARATAVAATGRTYSADSMQQLTGTSLIKRSAAVNPCTARRSYVYLQDPRPRRVDDASPIHQQRWWMKKASSTLHNPHSPDVIRERL